MHPGSIGKAVKVAVSNRPVGRKADHRRLLQAQSDRAQALIDSASRRCLINGDEKISRYQLQTPPYPDLIRVMQRHPSRPSIRRVFRAAIEQFSVILRTLSLRCSRRGYEVSGGVRDEPTHGSTRLPCRTRTLARVSMLTSSS